MLDLKRKWALITGASRGIGHETAIYMAKQGISLVLHSRDLASTKSLVAEVKSLGVEAFAVAAELSDDVAVRKMALEVVNKVQIDILLNNAGVQAPSQSTYYMADVEQYLWQYKVNVIAPMILVEVFLPGMLKRGFGRIVNTTSGIKNQPEQGGYAASKGALDKVTKDFATKLEGTGVSMNVTDPGWIQTDLGGPNASNTVDTVVPGVVVSVFTSEDVNGKWISAQSFKGMDLVEAVAKASEIIK